MIGSDGERGLAWRSDGEQRGEMGRDGERWGVVGIDLFSSSALADALPAVEAPVLTTMSSQFSRLTAVGCQAPQLPPTR